MQVGTAITILIKDVKNEARQTCSKFRAFTSIDGVIAIRKEAICKDKLSDLLVYHLEESNSLEEVDERTQYSNTGSVFLLRLG